jgi:hypothetical protein
MTTPLNTIQFNQNTFKLEETVLSGIFTMESYITWEIGLYPEGEENYIMFNSLIFADKFTPAALSGLIYSAESHTSDLYGHTVYVDGAERFIDAISIRFGQLNTKDQTINLSGSGIIGADEDLPEVAFTFNADLHIKAIYLFETSKDAAEKYVEDYLGNRKDELALVFEQAPSGFMATITGKF